jgi:hypothetical protein
MKLSIVKFHSPVALGGKTLTTVNLKNKQFNQSDRYEINYESGLVTIKDNNAKAGSSSIAMIGLANITYMCPEEVKTTAKARSPRTKKSA